MASGKLAQAYLWTSLDLNRCIFGKVCIFGVFAFNEGTCAEKFLFF